MKSKFTALLLCLCSICLILGGCQFGSSSTPSDTETADTAVSEQEQIIDETIFPKDKVVDVKITIDEDQFQDMLDNASAEEFKPASVEYNGHKFDNVGIRTKGNLSLRSVVQMEDSDRYSFKISFDEYVNQTFEGISKINLNNNYSDASSMREFLAYELAEQMGLPTPKYSYVNVYVNDELWGFYLAVEQIGESYLERNFENSYGSLYKADMSGQGTDLAWYGEDPESYSGLLAKSDKTDDTTLVKMINELNNGSDIEQYLDVENALKYIALNVVTNNTDSYIGMNKHNYYLYEENGVYSVLPWDYNMAFGGLGGDMGGGGFGGGMGRMGRDNSNSDTNTDNNANAAPDQNAGANATTNTDSKPSLSANGNVNAETNPSTDADANTDASMQEDGNAGNALQASTALLIDEPTSGAVDERPLVAKLLANEQYKEQYHQIIEEAVTGLLAEETFKSRVQELKSMISEYVKADPNAFYTYDEFEQGVTSLISTNASQVNNISQQLDGTIASSGDGSGSGGGMGGGFGGRGNAQNTAAAGNQQGNAEDGQAVPSNQGTNAEQAPQTGAAQAAQSEDGGQTAVPPSASNGAQSNAADQTTTDEQGNTADPFGEGMGQPPEGFDPTQMGEMPEGFDPSQMGQRPEGGFGGMGGGGGFPGGQQQNTQQGSTSEMIITSIALVLLILACVFIAFYKRKRL
ncbi:CotH kinase family protein [Neobacillus mesonae]|nr:CotH kinase family protein [Neobacillus mesonae]